MANDPQTKINLSLSLAHVEHVVTALSELPYKEVADVIKALHVQTVQQLSPEAIVGAESSPQPE